MTINEGAIGNKLDDIAERIENLAALDGPARYVQRLAEQVVTGRVRETLSGAPIRHPLHPALVAVPIGSWVSASVLDLTGGNRKAAKRLVGLGVLTALPTAVAGAVDWTQVDADKHPEAVRVAFVHALINDLAVAVYTASWLARRRGHFVRGTALAVLGSQLIAVSGWLGGHLAYARGVNVQS